MRHKSLLFVPMTKFEKRIYARLEKESDAIILDLEDSVSTSDKHQARLNLIKVCERFTNKNIYIRVNSDDEFDLDMQFILSNTKIRKLVYPKFESVDRLKAYDLANLEIIPIIETPTGLLKAYEILNTIPNLNGVLFGSEDLSASLGIDPCELNMTAYAQQLILICAALKVPCYGFASDFTFLSVEKAKQNCIYAKMLGFKGAHCVHPSQLRIINEIFNYEEVELNDSHDGYNGVTSVSGKMIGPPALKRMQNR